MSDLKNKVDSAKRELDAALDNFNVSKGKMSERIDQLEATVSSLYTMLVQRTKDIESLSKTNITLLKIIKNIQTRINDLEKRNPVLGGSGPSDPFDIN